MINILYEKDGYEYYLNEDNRLISRRVDNTKDYRTKELRKEVVEVLDKARSQGKIPLKTTIDYLIDLQRESVEKATNYACYRYLGTMQHKDVFGKEAEERYDNQRKWREIQSLKRTVREMKMQQDEMHKLLINMAKYMNVEKKSFQRASF